MVYTAMVDAELLESLRSFDTPTICNVIELFDVRPRNQGYMDHRVQSNFPDYPLLRMDEMPTVTVVHVESGEAHGGVGEPGVPPVAPAICNALLALTGAPQRRLPLLG